LYRVVLFRSTKFDTKRYLLLSTHRSLCCLRVHHVSGLLPNHCDCLVLRSRPVVEECETDDWEGTLVVLQIVLVDFGTVVVDRK
jgi:hypothetical protein